MRCTNCGWPNPPQATKCAKCGSPLSSTPSNNPAHNEQEFRPVDNADPRLKKTVNENDRGGGTPVFQQSNQENSVEMSTCPKCGYPLRPGISNCPNCNFKIGEVHHRPVENVPYTPEPSARHRPTSPDVSDPQAQPVKNVHGAHGGTILPSWYYQSEAGFTLKPLKRVNERHELDEREFEGATVVLNRDNTEPGNGSITSKEQAVITHEGNDWFIQDRSEQKTTFVHCGQKLQLHDGDIILLGNRLFVFHEY